VTESDATAYLVLALLRRNTFRQRDIDEVPRSFAAHLGSSLVHTDHTPSAKPTRITLAPASPSSRASLSGEYTYSRSSFIGSFGPPGAAGLTWS
jgi:hypothetical protein